jgi:hypothetical protein
MPPRKINQESASVKRSLPPRVSPPEGTSSSPPLPKALRTEAVELGPRTLVFPPRVQILARPPRLVIEPFKDLKPVGQELEQAMWDRLGAAVEEIYSGKT